MVFTIDSRKPPDPPALYLTVSERVVFFRILRFTVGDSNLNIFTAQDDGIDDSLMVSLNRSFNPFSEKNFSPLK
jgi:hypothetical protein